MRRLLTATLLLLLLLPAARALAGDNASDLLIDACRDEHVDGTYSQRTYKRALDELPADSDQYTACRDVIERARIAALQKRSSGRSRNTGRASTAPAPRGSNGGGSRGSGGGSASPAPAPSASPTPAPAPTPRRSSERRRRSTPRSTPAPATTTAAPAPPAEPPVLPVGPVGDVTAPATRLPTAIVVLLAAIALGVLLAASTLAWNRVVVRRR